MDRIESLQVFVRVAEAGSFAAVARELDLSPAMVAKHIQAIEARLGAPLLYRTTRRQSLTDTGRLYLERCRAVLTAFETAEAAATELQAEPRGVLRVTAPVVLGSRGLAPLLPGFMARHPHVKVELALHDRVVDLMDEGYDVALRSGPLPADMRLVARPLRPLRMVLCAAPAYLRRHGVPRVPADLAAHACLGFSHWAHPDRWRLIGPDGEHAVPVTTALTMNNGEALRQAALAGAGVLMQWEVLVREDIAARRLVRVLPRYAPPERPAHLLYLPDRRPSAKLQSFVTYVLQTLGP
ncbi:LysR family transcriptional regulator [Caldimonas brevitalea]|uniref:LysR family transcriptional regulator n=1 Tax=Caldimonas brevitalea TaxID=413882 RepID=A0A0G3BUI1_9BURK|nr:LysR family transcriptional regulator [Caldimonas brevitalea]AKJ31678.1 LysR family transcriptional regulator [Caldimonas brevitalea]